jgi:poly(ADP-ribose) glycohydrolase ARH3
VEQLYKYMSMDLFSLLMPGFIHLRNLKDDRPPTGKLAGVQTLDVGSALGDAIGELAFRYRAEDDLRARLDQLNELRYTDDTAMSIGLAESIITKGDLEQQDLGDTFRRNFLKEPWRGYASGPPTIFSLVERYGATYREAAKSLFGGEGSLGNGAAMRIVSSVPS